MTAGNLSEPIIITGTPNSGIWIVAGVVRACGAFGGNLDAGLPGKPGTFENPDIREMVERPFLKGLKCDPRGHNRLPDIKKVKEMASSLAPEWQRLVTGIFMRQAGGNENITPLIVSNVAGLIWPVWTAAFPKAKWVIIRRDERDIINACLKTGFYTAYANEKGWREMVDYYIDRFSELTHTSGLTVRTIKPKYILAGDVSRLKTMVESYGLEWNLEAIKDFGNPIWWKSAVYEVKE